MNTSDTSPLSAGYNNGDTIADCHDTIELEGGKLDKRGCVVPREDDFDDGLYNKTRLVPISKKFIPAQITNEYKLPFLSANERDKLDNKWDITSITEECLTTDDDDSGVIFKTMNNDDYDEAMFEKELGGGKNKTSWYDSYYNEDYDGDSDSVFTSEEDMMMPLEGGGGEVGWGW